MNVKGRLFGVCALPAVVSACGAEPLERGPGDTPPESTAIGSSDFEERLQSLDRDLDVGSKGDDVATVHAYLMRYGYFPNEGLRRAFPKWRPVVAAGPASDSIYDERTAEAVKRFQSFFRVPVSGIVDFKTREAMRMPRCGNPEGISDGSDPSEKFALFNKFWGSTAKWLFQGSLFPSDPNYRNRTRDAVNTWKAQTSLHFTEIASGSYDISISFGTIQCWPFVPCNTDAWAVTWLPDITGNHSDIRINTGKRWYYGTGDVPQDNLTGDYQSVVLHELGHAIGLDHSSIGGDGWWGTIMYPGIAAGANKRTLSVDDKIAVSTHYDQWQLMDSDTTDVGIGANGDVWVVAGDHSVWTLRGGGWHWTGADASRITVAPNGWPFVIAGWGDGSIWYRNSNSPDNGPPPGQIEPPRWEQFPGNACARDLGIGPDWGLWIIGCEPGPDGTIWKWTGESWTQSHVGGWATSIAVGDDGRPWVVDSGGAVYQYTTNDPWTGTWRLVTLPSAGGHIGAVDIGVGPAPYPYIAGTGAGNFYVLNEQGQIGDGGPGGAPWRREWRGLPNIGRGWRIAVGPNGEPWALNTNRQLYKTVK
jgi:hypothetical protein